MVNKDCIDSWTTAHLLVLVPLGRLLSTFAYIWLLYETELKGDRLNNLGQENMS